MKLNAKERLFEFELWAKASARADITGLPGDIVVWVNPKLSNKHGPRIKVSNIRGRSGRKESDFFSVSIEDSPKIYGRPLKFLEKEITAIKEWAILNKKPLLTLWAQEDKDDYPAFFNALKKWYPEKER